MRLRTIRGYDFGEVSSAMQKAIRRGETSYAGYWALELLASGFGHYVWKRLLTVSAEDCWGIITKEVKALHESYAMINANLSGRRARGRIFISKAVILLCAAKKSRDADHLQVSFTTKCAAAIQTRCPMSCAVRRNTCRFLTMLSIATHAAASPWVRRRRTSSKPSRQHVCRLSRGFLITLSTRMRADDPTLPDHIHLGTLVEQGLVPILKKEPMEEIEMAIRAGAIKSLIAVNFQPGADFWLEKLHIPTAFMNGSKSTGVSTGSHTFLRIALESLQAKGCRSVGLITHIAQSKIDSDFIDICQSLELVTDESLIMHASSGDMVPGELVPRSFERFGYEKFQELWLGRSRPLDGVVVFPDHAARGVVTAILQHGIRVGVDFHLALHRNEGIDYFCPVPASFISTSIGDIAKSLIGQLESQILSIPYSTIELPYKLVEDDPNPGR
jgi:DNA-binding LacI/PurR family transcriptional regulator